MAQKILIIEDDQSLREVYAEVLRDDGFDVDEAINGVDGLKKARERSYDLVLLDIMLPKIDGLELLKELRNSPETRGLKIVLLTNLGRESIIKEGFELGADGYLIKSEHDPGQILEEVKKFLEEQ